MPLKRQNSADRQLGYYLGIGLIAAFCLVAITWISVVYHLQWPGKRWSAFAFITPLAFWYPAQMFKSLWTRPAFWLVFATLIAAHIFGFTVILERFPDWRVAWFVPTTMIEGMLVILILHAVFPEKRRDPERRHFE